MIKSFSLYYIQLCLLVIQNYICVHVSETKKFVDLLFKTLETQDYLLQASQENLIEPISSPRINPSDRSVNSEQLVEPTVTQFCSVTNPALLVQTNGSTVTSTQDKRESRKSESEKEDKDKRTRSR